MSHYWSESGLIRFPPWTEVKSLRPELRFLWHHRNNLTADTNGVLWRKRSSEVSQLQQGNQRWQIPRPATFQCFQENLTVEHILIHCAEYFHVRYQCFDVNNLGELFRTVSPNIIIQFIKRAGLLYLI